MTSPRHQFGPPVAAAPKPDNRPAARERLFRLALQLFAGALVLLILYDGAKHFLLADYSIWHALANTVVFASVFASGLTCLVFAWTHRRGAAWALPRGVCSGGNAQEADRESEQRYRDLVEGASDILYSHDIAGNLTDWGGAGRRILGYTPEEAVRMNISQIVVPEQLERARRMTARKVADGGETAYDLDVVTKDGRHLTMEICSQIRYEKGQPVHVTGIARDVTERNKTRELLRRESALLHNVISNIPYSVFWKDQRGVYLGCNDKSARDLGKKDIEEVVGKTDFDMPFSRDEAEFYVQCDQKVMASGQPMLNIEETQLRPDGSRAVLLTGKVPLRAADGEIIGILGIYTDITERKRAEEALRAAEARYRLLFDANPQPMWVFDAETLGILAVNDAATNHYGYSRDEFLLMSVENIRCHDQPAGHRNGNGRAPDGGESSNVYKHRKKDGTAIDVEESSHGLVFGDRNAIIVLAHDVTERLRIEELLRQSQKMEAVGQLAGGVAHDFNNLLTVIIGYTEMLLGQADVPHSSHDLLQQIEKAAQRAASLTQQLLAYGRRQILKPAVLDLNTVVKESAKLLRRLIGEDVELVLDLTSDLKPVRIDPGQMDQILMNLAANARDAMARGGRLTVGTSSVTLSETDVIGSPELVPGNYVVIAVRDTGCGMARETVARVFEPFFTTKEVGKGTGLGLATVYGIVRQSGGYVTVDSDLGRGTTFRIYFPECGNQLDQPGYAARVVSEGGHETVLLVEDEAGLRKLAHITLQTKGYRVLEAQDAHDAIKIAEGCEGPLDLLVTDVVMPNLSGRELADRLLGFRPGLKVLFMSGYTDDTVLRHGVCDTGAPFLQKPFSPGSLAAKVREVLGEERRDQPR